MSSVADIRYHVIKFMVSSHDINSHVVNSHSIKFPPDQLEIIASKKVLYHMKKIVSKSHPTIFGC